MVLIVEPTTEDIETSIWRPGGCVIEPARQLLNEDLLAQFVHFVWAGPVEVPLPRLPEVQAEKPFVGYHAALALRFAARTFGASDYERVSKAIREAKSALLSAPGYRPGT